MKKYCKGITLVSLIITIVTILLCVALPVLVGFEGYLNEEEKIIVIKDKYIKRSGEEDIYLVATEEGETYKIADLIFKWKFNSTDIYNDLDIGKTYKVETTGFRIHILSWYKNINKYELIEEIKEE